MYTERKATRKNIREIKDNIRPESLEQMGITVEEFRRAVKASVETSDYVSAFIMNGKCHAIAGYKYNRETFKTAVWAISTPLTDDHGPAIVKAANTFINRLGGELYALINPQDPRVVRLMEATGFKPSLHVNPVRQFFVKE